MDPEFLFDVDGEPIPTRILPDGRTMQVYKLTYSKGRLGITRNLYRGLDHSY